MTQESGVNGAGLRFVAVAKSTSTEVNICMLLVFEDMLWCTRKISSIYMKSDIYVENFYAMDARRMLKPFRTIIVDDVSSTFVILAMELFF
jgi:hypothetical protein